MSLSQLQHGKVYRFRYTDQRFRDRGIRTALFLGDDGTGTYSGLSVKCLDLEKGEYRNFIPRSMAEVRTVTCDVGYVNIGKLSSDLYAGILKTWEAAGYTVFRDGDHVNAVKGWDKKSSVTMQTLVGGVGFDVDSSIALYVYACDDQVGVWNNQRAAYDLFGKGQYLNAMKALRNRADEAIRKAEE